MIIYQVEIGMDTSKTETWYGIITNEMLLYFISTVKVIHWIITINILLWIVKFRILDNP